MPSGDEIRASLAACEADLKQVETELTAFQSGENTTGSAQHYKRLRDRQASLTEQIRHLRKEAADARN